MKKAPVNLNNIVAWIQGNLRYRTYYSKSPLLRVLMRTHIREQIGFRISFMKSECYNQGSCVMCGCQTTHLQMADKSCEGPCYPTMMNAMQWQRFKGEWPVTDANGTWRYVPAERSSSGKAFLVLTRNHTYVGHPYPPATIYLNQNQN